MSKENKKIRNERLDTNQNTLRTPWYELWKPDGLDCNSTSTREPSDESVHAALYDPDPYEPSDWRADTIEKATPEQKKRITELQGTIFSEAALELRASSNSIPLEDS